MRRPEFIGVLGSAVAWPLAADAQQQAPVIGYFSARSADSEAPWAASVRLGLAETGFTEGRNVAFEFRFANGQEGRLPSLAAELVRRPVALLVATDRPSAVAAKAATGTTPIVFASGVDPVQDRLVASFNRPGANATGFNIFTSQLGPKRLELLRELVPDANLIAFIVNPGSGAAPIQTKDVEAAARVMGQQILVVNAGNEKEIVEAFATIVQRKADAILFSANPFFQVHRELIVALAARHAIPTMYEWREFVDSGGLISYSTNRPEAFRQIGIYAGRILKGEKAADLPVARSTKFETVVNLKTARAMGLTVPQAIMLRADEVIE
jgi:putative tryptophan/tyrosine transport system substrate-binding protein